MLETLPPISEFERSLDLNRVVRKQKQRAEGRGGVSIAVVPVVVGTLLSQSQIVSGGIRCGVVVVGEIAWSPWRAWRWRWRLSIVVDCRLRLVGCVRRIVALVDFHF